MFPESAGFIHVGKSPKKMFVRGEVWTSIPTVTFQADQSVSNSSTLPVGARGDVLQSLSKLLLKLGIK